MVNGKIVLIMSTQITTKSDPSKDLKSLAKRFRPAEDRVLALVRFNDEYGRCGGDLKNMDPETISSAIHAAGIESLTMLAKGFNGDDRRFVLSLADQFIEEYKCTQASEKATAQLAARAFTNVLVLSLKFSEVDVKEVGQYNALSKEMDRANRQYIQAIKLLRTLKQPKITVNVKTNEAYFAHNQQVNHEQK